MTAFHLKRRFFWFMASLMTVSLVTTLQNSAQELDLNLRFQKESKEKSNQYHTLQKSEKWDPKETAIIVCDVWDAHHCYNAVQRVNELAPRLNEVLIKSRQMGVTIIHSPSSCMDAYKKHPARLRAIAAPKSNTPKDIESWCYKIPQEEKGVYPLDQSDGGEDDDPVEHEKWAKKLSEMGRNPRAPWKSQTATLKIDDAKDFISDQGIEVWNILEDRKIKNVILTGVHTNMCVLGRPFGLRQMSKNGKNVVLMRDMTDTMYNPESWPYVSHFTGTDLIVSHIEKFVCPTITSDQILGGKPFRFKNDRRPHVVFVMAEDEYKTSQSLPPFAVKYLGNDFRVSYVFGNPSHRDDIPGLEVLENADVAVISVRRRPLPKSQMDPIKKFIAAGKPVIGIRTASHAFSLRKARAENKLVDWPEFDAEVFGGNYTNHYGNDLKSTIQTESDSTNHPILDGLAEANFQQGGSLYKTAPLKKGAKILMMGKVQGKEAEPVAWTFQRKEGGKSFYTSLGHVDDFKNPNFLRLLSNAVYWSAGKTPSSKKFANLDNNMDWDLVVVPEKRSVVPISANRTQVASSWYRSTLRITSGHEKDAKLKIQSTAKTVDCWVNGVQLETNGKNTFHISAKDIQLGDANLVVIKLGGKHDASLNGVSFISAAGKTDLAGRWQFKNQPLTESSANYTNIPLPAKFGGSADIFFDVQ